ncbi:MAG: hypothetical protein QOE48_4941 [Mycobacterium sp.]|jgi:hypothetical protein|nr:hypothetical protein [Mycobacterium sp.]MDT5309239.1 hypothetical protein [Mycobacterium sp.]
MWDWLAAAVGIQHRTQRGDGVAVRALVDVHATAVGFHEPGSAQLAGRGRKQR